MPRMPLPAFKAAPHSQPYAIPARGTVHGPIGAVPQVPQSANRSFTAARGNAGGPIGGHLPHQHGSQQALGSIGSPLENANSQPSVGGSLSQTGLMTQVLSNQYYVPIFLLVNCFFYFLCFQIIDASTGF